MDPWSALGENADVGNTIAGTGAMYAVLQRIGIYGCIITAVIFLMMLAFRWGDPRLQSEFKEKFMWKFIVVFMICAFAGILGLVMNVAKKMGGYT